MASSQVEIASSAPFGCVLRDHNRRDRCRAESNARATQTALQKNLKNLVRNHLQTCVSISRETSQNQQQIDYPDSSWIANNEEERENRNKSLDSNGNRNVCSMISSRQAWILGRWGAKDGKELVPTIEAPPTNDVDILGLANSATSSPGPSTSRREDNNVLVRSDSLGEISSLGASSLVQIWERRLSKSHSMNSNASRCDSGTSCNEIASSAASSVDERFDVCPVTEDSFLAWNGNRNAQSDQPCCSSSQEQSLDSGESERVRVADIIRRLTAANQAQSSLSSLSDDNYDNEHYSSTNASPSREHERSSTPDQLEHRGFSPVRYSPRIRGRQAFNDLLMQIERDRHGELEKLVDRRVVSRFSQKGRIQSLLRLRLLQRGIAIHEQQRPQSGSSQFNKQSQSSTIMHLRERFNNGFDQQGATAHSDNQADSRSPQREMANDTIDSDNSSIPNTPNEGAHDHEANFTEGQSPEFEQNPLSYASEDLQENSNPSFDVIWQGTTSETGNLESQETTESTTLLDGWDANDAIEEVQDNYQQYSETNYDWISDISRPRSYWEDRRKAWYQEMLNCNSENEICQLLERRTVSNFLCSAFRERIDRLMVTHLERQVRQENEEEDEEPNHEQLMSYLQGRMHLAETQQQHQQELEEEEEQEQQQQQHLQEEEEEENDEEEEEEEEEESVISGQYQEGSAYINQSTSSLQIPPSSLLGSWGYQDNEVGDESDLATSTPPTPSPHQHLPSQSYYHGTVQCSPATITSSIEMELIYDLRRHMEQLYHEMSELRKSIKGCMDMQMTMQQSIKQEVNSVQGEGKSHEGAPKKGNCCICYEMKVDSLLYRCGHMCTCLKCAHELQWSSGKCPICRAPIVDVVRAYMDT